GDRFCAVAHSSRSPGLRPSSPPTEARELTPIFSSPRPRFGGEGQGEGARWFRSTSILSQLFSLPEAAREGVTLSQTSTRISSNQPVAQTLRTSLATRSRSSIAPVCVSRLSGRCVPSILRLRITGSPAVSAAQHGTGEGNKMAIVAILQRDVEQTDKLGLFGRTSPREKRLDTTGGFSKSLDGISYLPNRATPTEQIPSRRLRKLGAKVHQTTTGR